MSLNLDALNRAANEARGLAMDAVHACSSGHLGLPLGCAEIGAVLYGHALRHNPDEPRWLNRDRFVLSAGHGSMFLYGWLHLSGYPEMTIDEVKHFRQLGSRTPGHPESFETRGVECTTGPLGQGVANAVGIAISQKMAAARFNTPEHTIFDNHVICLAGDGCLQEGIAQEAASFAGHQKLDNLILIYDSNDVTLDAMADKTQSEDAAKKFEALGWNVQVLRDGNDLMGFYEALRKAQSETAKPQLIIARTLIGKGIPEIAGTSKAHGEAGAKFVDAARKGLGLPEDQHFFVSAETHAYFAGHKKALIADYEVWQKDLSGLARRKSGAREASRRRHILRSARGPAFTHPRVSGRCENRHAQGRQRRPSTGRRGVADAHLGERRSPWLDPQLHQWRRRLRLE